MEFQNFEKSLTEVACPDCTVINYIKYDDERCFICSSLLLMNDCQEKEINEKKYKECEEKECEEKECEKKECKEKKCKEKKCEEKECECQCHIKNKCNTEISLTINNDQVTSENMMVQDQKLLSNKVWQILDIDKNYSSNRVCNVNNIEDQDLYSLENIKPQKWDYSLPTITLKERSDLSNTHLQNKKYRKKLYQNNPELKEIFRLFTKESPICPVIAGGYPAKMITDSWKNSSIDLQNADYLHDNLQLKEIHCDSISDIDFFFYSGSNSKKKITVNSWLKEMEIENENETIEEDDEIKKENANEVITKILTSLYAYWQQKNDNETYRLCLTKTNFVLSLYVYKTKKSIDESIIWIQVAKYQFIYRIFESISEILHDFDLGSCQVGFDGFDFYLTSLGKFAFDYKCNILDVTKISPFYEKRLIKYFCRGFDIIMPYLNSKSNVIELNNGSFILYIDAESHHNNLYLSNYQINYFNFNCEENHNTLFELYAHDGGHKFQSTILNFNSIEKEITEINFNLLVELFFNNKDYILYSKLIGCKYNLIKLLKDSKNNWIYFNSDVLKSPNDFNMSVPLVNIINLIYNYIIQPSLQKSIIHGTNGRIFKEHFIKNLFFGIPKSKSKFLELYLEKIFISGNKFDENSLKLYYDELIQFYTQLFQTQMKYLTLNLSKTLNWQMKNDDHYKMNVQKIRGYPTLKSYYGSHFNLF